VLPSGDDSFPKLIKKRRSQLGFVTYLLAYLRMSGRPYWVYLKFLGSLQVWVPLTKTRKRNHINICLHRHVCIRGTAQQFVDFITLSALLGPLKPSQCSQLHFQIKRRFSYTFLCPFHFSHPLRHVWKLDSPQSDVCMRALAQLEGILSICCELFNIPGDGLRDWNM
jgi:hypothetical protein